MTLKVLFRVLILIIVIIFLSWLWYSALSGLSDINLNSNQHHSKTILLTYPNIEPEGLLVSMDMPNYSLPVKLQTNITLQYQGVLAENTPVTVLAKGNLYDASFPMKFLTVGFESANSNVARHGEIIMRDSITCPRLNYASIDLNNELGAGWIRPIIASQNIETIYWDSPGDYTPYVTIWYLNNTPITYEYPTEKIHVAGSDVVIQEKFAVVNLWLTIAVLFATSIMLILAIIPETYSKWLITENK